MAVFQVQNFMGNLTRKTYGTMNSGMARIGKTHSVNPFYIGGALAFSEAATNLDPTHATFLDTVVGGATNVESGVLYVYCIDRSGNVYKINTSNDSVSTLSTTMGVTLKYGGGLKIVTSGSTQYIVVAHDNGAFYCPTSSVSPGSLTNITNTGLTWGSSMNHPISDEFAGYLYIGNTYNLVQWSIGSLAVIANSVLNPTFPNIYNITTLGVDGQGRYLRVTATTQTNFVDINTQNPGDIQQAVTSRTLYWNGSDPTYDSTDPFVQTNNKSSFSFLGTDVTFGNDWFGMGIYTDSQGTMDKMMALPGVRQPMNGAIAASGPLMFFGAPYYVTDSGTETQLWKTGIFAFGNLDDTDQPGLYNVLSIAPTNNTICSAVGFMILVQNYVTKSDGTVLANSKFYVSTYETGTSAASNMYSFNLTPGSGTLTTGIFESMIELATLQQSIIDINIYMAPASSGVSFRFELIDVNSSVVSGSSYTYTYASGSDPTLVEGSIEVLPVLTPGIKYMQGMGVRITNLGTVQPNILGIYIETQDVTKTAIQPTT